jgi:outer membrane protein
MSFTRTVLCLAGFLSACIASSPAQLQSSNPDSSVLSILSHLSGTRLTLEQAIGRSLQGSPSILAAEAAVAAARGVTRREGGTFDPELFLSWHYTDQKQPTASFFAGASLLHTLQADGNAGVKWNLPTGTKLEASLDAVRLNTNSSFAFLTPQYTTTGMISLRQPLLRGFTVSARKGLAGAEQQLEAAEARLTQESLGLRTAVEQLYWDLYAAERDYAVEKMMRDRAAAFLKETDLRAQTGLIGPSQVANARTFLAEQELLLLDREEQLDRLSDRLAATLGVRPEQGEVRFKTVDQPKDTFPIGESEALVRDALERNLGLRAAKAEIEARRTYADAASWEALPSVDLVGSLGGSGLAGTAHDVIFGSDTLRTTVGGGLGDALRQTVNRDFPNWHIGLEVQVPIGFRSGLGEQDRLEAEVTIAEERLKQEERILEAEIRSGWRELTHGQRRLNAAREGVAAAQEQTRIGLIEFQNGRTTAFELVRLASDFAIAQQRYSQALVRSAKTASVLRQLTSGAYDPAALQQ